ncbi:MAG: DUF1080 domain-containing protein [Gemmatimonadetes bacterium]|nr:DUF1080 domain-containing protein [Gemmatimonadota bacterium]
MVQTGRILAAALLTLTAAARAQQPGGSPTRLPPDTIHLRDLSAFRTPPAGWRVVGGATADLARAARLSTAAGSGVLANVASPGSGQNLVTSWDHGDIELDLDFMMPKGSSSGVFLQGRYEVQLADSWGKRSVTHADAGAISPRVGATGEALVEGRAPRVNASLAPGLWQTMRVVFRAPRFDAQGRKTDNARFTEVVLNGVPVHSNVEVSGPTRAAPFAQESATGPLVIEGSAGPVVFRNIRYKLDRGQRVQLSGLRYRVYEGDFSALPDLAGRTPTREGAADALTPSVLGGTDRFAFTYDGTIEIPVAGGYLFELSAPWATPQGTDPGSKAGGGRLTIAGREVIVHAAGRPSYSATVELPAGRHPLSLVFYKNRANRTPAFELHVEGPAIARHGLHRVENIQTPNITAPILTEPQRDVLVLRSFMTFGGSKRTHVASVGDPSGVHYSIDLGRGALLYAWRGPFAETTQMWSGRGEPQIAEPLGAVVRLSGAPSIAILREASAAWPDSTQADAPYRLQAYSVDQEGRPTFRYQVGPVQVEETLRPAQDGTTLRRELRMRAPDSTGGVYVRLAEGASVAPLRDRTYAVDDLRYYVTVESGTPTPMVRAAGARQEILVPVRFRGGEARIVSGIVW